MSAVWPQSTRGRRQTQPLSLPLRLPAEAVSGMGRMLTRCPFRQMRHGPVCNMARSGFRYGPFCIAISAVWQGPLPGAAARGGARGPWAGLCGIFPRLFDVPPDGCFAFVPCLKSGSTLCPASCMPLWLAVARRPFGSGARRCSRYCAVFVSSAYGLFGLKGAYPLCRWLIMFRFQRGVSE